MGSIPNEIMLDILSPMGKKDLLKFRLVNSNWNEISTKLLGQKNITVSLITKMEAKLFKEILGKGAPRNPIFNEVKLSLDSIPSNVLEELAFVLNSTSAKLRIHLIQIMGPLASYPTPAPCVKGLMILQHIPNVTSLHVPSTINLYVDGFSQIQIQELEINLPIFRSLTKITWNADTKLLFSILERAPMLQLLQIENQDPERYIRGFGFENSHLIKVSELLEKLPPNTTLQTELRLYYDRRDDTEELLARMCNFPNKISILTLDSSSDTENTNPFITEFLASQSGSLNSLNIKGMKRFQLPKLEYLESLTIKSTLPDSGLNPSLFPRLSKVTISSDEEVVKLFACHGWLSVRTLHIEPEDEMPLRNEILSQLATCFPKLKKLTTFWDDIRFELTGSQETFIHLNQNGFLQSSFLVPAAIVFGPYSNLRQLRIFECPIKILDALVVATSAGNLKLHTLEVELFVELTENERF